MKMSSLPYVKFLFSYFFKKKEHIYCRYLVCSEVAREDTVCMSLCSSGILLNSWHMQYVSFSALVLNEDAIVDLRQVRIEQN